MPNMPTSPLDHRVGPPQGKFSVCRRFDRWRDSRPWRSCAIDGMFVEFLPASYGLNGRISGLVPLYRPAGLG
jgi:hypothetical protein